MSADATSSPEACEAKHRDALLKCAVEDPNVRSNLRELTRLAAQLCAARFCFLSIPTDGPLFLDPGFSCADCDESAVRTIFGLALAAKESFAIEDIQRDPLFMDRPFLLGGRQIRFFAGVPLRVPVKRQLHGTAFGLLALIDETPRRLGAEQTESVCAIARHCMHQLELMAGHVRLREQHEQAELALKRSEAFFHSLVETIPQNIFRKDARGRFTFANSNFCRSVNRGVEEIIGKTDFDLFPPELAIKY